jgi:CBS domain-containing protein
MRIKDIMSKTVITVSPTTTIAEAINLMIGARISGVPVVDEAGALVGVLSESDLLRRVEVGTQRRRSHWLEWLIEPGRLAAEYVRANGRLAREVMTVDPITIADDASVKDAVSIMERRKVKRLPVVHGGKLVGIISRADVIRSLAGFVAPAYEEQATSDAEIHRRIVTELASQAWAPTASVDVEVKDGVVQLHGAIFDGREREALRVAAENIPGVRRVEDHLAWIEPFSGFVVPASPDADETRPAA